MEKTKEDGKATRVFLMRMFQFTYEDLEANRQGRFSVAQRKRLNREGFLGQIACVLIGGLAVVITGAVLSRMFPAPSIVAPCVCAILALTTFSAWYLVFLRYHFLLTARDVKVRHYALVREDFDSEHPYLIELETEKYRVDIPGFKGLASKRSCDIYIEPFTRTILSVEPAVSEMA